ncbi:MAG: disulfide bond formation protein B [Proteobacteria bacterium]|nr:disulfide bond formation protein B [Pseudomonadota bacterium]
MLNPFAWPYRAQFAAGFLACAAFLGYAFYVQFDLGIEPCPLCIFQRIALIVMGVIFLIGALHNPGAVGRHTYALLVLFGACAGLGVAAYHLWVQQQPPNPMAGCTPGWNYMVENFPINKVLKMAFQGHADCAEINWTFLGMAMPFWTLVSFAMLGIGALCAGFRKR